MLHKNFFYKQPQLINDKKIQISRNNTCEYTNDNDYIQKNNLNHSKNTKNVKKDLSAIDQLTSNIVTQIKQMKINIHTPNEHLINNYFKNTTYSFDAKSKIPKIKKIKIPKQYTNLPGARDNQNFLNQRLIDYIATDKPINSDNNYSNDNNDFMQIKNTNKENSVRNISLNSFNLSNNIININNNKNPISLQNQSKKLNYITHKRIFSTGVDAEIIKPLNNLKYRNGVKFTMPNFHTGVFDSYFIKPINDNKNEIDKIFSYSVIRGNNNSNYSNDNKSTKSKTQNDVDKSSSFSITSKNNTNKNILTNNNINISPFLTLDNNENKRELKDNNSNEIKTLNIIAKKINNIPVKKISNEKNKEIENKFDIFERSIEQKSKMDSILESIKQKRKTISYNNNTSNNSGNNINNSSHNKNKKSNKKKVHFCTENIIIRFEPDQGVQNLTVYNSHGKKLIKKFFKTGNYLNNIKLKNNKKSILKNSDINYKKLSEIDKNYIKRKKTYSFKKSIRKIKIRNSFYTKKNIELKNKKQEDRSKKEDNILSNEFINQIFDYSNLVNEEKEKIMNKFSVDKKKNNVLSNEVKNVNSVESKNQIISALKNIEKYIEETIK